MAPRRFLAVAPSEGKDRRAVSPESRSDAGGSISVFPRVVIKGFRAADDTEEVAQADLNSAQERPHHTSSQRVVARRVASASTLSESIDNTCFWIYTVIIREKYE